MGNVYEGIFVYFMFTIFSFILVSAIAAWYIGINDPTAPIKYETTAAQERRLKRDARRNSRSEGLSSIRALRELDVGLLSGSNVAMSYFNSIPGPPPKFSSTQPVLDSVKNATAALDNHSSSVSKHASKAVPSVTSSISNSVAKLAPSIPTAGFRPFSPGDYAPRSPTQSEERSSPPVKFSRTAQSSESSGNSTKSSESKAESKSARSSSSSSTSSKRTSTSSFDTAIHVNGTRRAPRPPQPSKRGSPTPGGQASRGADEVELV